MKAHLKFSLVVIFFLTVLFILGGVSTQNTVAAAGSCTRNSQCVSNTSICAYNRCFADIICRTLQDCTSYGASSTDGLYCTGGYPWGTCAWRSTGSTTPSSTPTFAPAPAPIPLSPAASITLPKKFTQKGSNSTKFNGLKQPAAKNYKGLVFEVLKVGKVEILEAVNLNDTDLVKKLKKINKYLTIENGRIGLESNKIKQLNKKSKLTFYNVKLILEQVELYKDGEPAGKSVSKISYNAKKNRYKFIAKKFSTYELASKITIDDDIVELATTGTEVPTLPFRFRVGDLDATILVTRNDESVEVIQPDEEGYVTADMVLDEGANDITIEVTTASSEITTSENISIEYNKPSPLEVLVPDNQQQLLIVIGGGIGLIALAAIVWFLMKKNGVNNRITAAVVLVVILVGGGLIFVLIPEETTPDVSVSEQVLKGSNIGRSNGSEISTAVEITSSGFAPAQIKVSAGELIKIKFYNTLPLTAFYFPELDIVSEVIEEGEEQIVEVQIPADARVQDEFKFIAAVSSTENIEGTLVVN